jgi:hypothetical protein
VPFTFIALHVSENAVAGKAYQSYVPSCSLDSTHDPAFKAPVPTASNLGTRPSLVLVASPYVVFTQGTST